MECLRLVPHILNREQNMIDYNIFENAVMNTIFNNKNEDIENLKEQYKNSSVVSREFSGVGFFTEFATQKQNQCRALKFKLGCSGSINDVEYGVGFILFIVDGYIKMLEGYTYAGETWPEKITKYELFL